MIVLLRYAALAGFVVLWIWCVADVVTADTARLGRLPKAGWVALVLLLPVVGMAAWLLLGRRTARIPVRRRPSGAPDDDPDFLSRLAEEIRRRNREEPPGPAPST
jgi:hypothetical protein